MSIPIYQVLESSSPAVHIQKPLDSVDLDDLGRFRGVGRRAQIAETHWLKLWKVG